jgi:hypothetical protein
MIIFIQIYLLLLNLHYNNVLLYKQSIKMIILRVCLVVMIIFNKNHIDYIRKRNRSLIQSLIMKYHQIDFHFNQQLVIHRHLSSPIHVRKISINLIVIHFSLMLHLSLPSMMMIQFQALVVFVHV